MRKSVFALAVACVALIAISCGPANQKAGESSASPEVRSMSDSVAIGGISSSAAVATSSDTARKFIRTADLKFRVEQVIQTTYLIEDIVKAHGGFVTLTNLSSDTDDETRKRVSADSVVIVSHYTLRNFMTIRVPNALLDTTLKQIAPLMDYLDYRTIKATDVGLDVLSNRLAVQRSRKHNQRIETSTKPKEALKDVVNASESMMNSDEKADQAAIANLTLADQINFSTVNLEIYQRPAVKYTVIADARSIDKFKPGYGSQIWEAFVDGFYIFKIFFLFLIRIWWLILMGIAGFILYPVYKKRKKS